ncbi:hypothetical protein [Pseudalkalibacillus hwajinpoensis]|uniref:Uncharacterized protein n=1 Tax=Guptibacillus hwajinpoensis TaxID=208199 RepID=A0A4U1MGB9_9BACL|nr:hypothetical protein [Pseudalkalibacillus hwajinpoensis]TKD69376.1 hypothetical protein FBF83_15415 [Pseudalkalibacillus hwajinpoensis]
MKNWMIGTFASVMLAGGIAGANVYAADDSSAENEEPAVEQSQGQEMKGHHGKRGHFKENSEHREAIMETYNKQNQLIDLLLDQDASSVEGVDELQKELADINTQLTTLHEEAQAARDERKAQMQELKDSGERPQLTDEEKAAHEAERAQMEEKRTEAYELVQKKNEVMDALIKKLS